MFPVTFGTPFRRPMYVYFLALVVGLVVCFVGYLLLESWLVRQNPQLHYLFAADESDPRRPSQPAI